MRPILNKVMSTNKADTHEKPTDDWVVFLSKHTHLLVSFY